ncbi:MAG: type II toxin-antitoxin system VapC family toxin [Candidatus Dormibacteraceae bacterium]
MRAYFDTSALLKLFLNEPGGITVRRAWQAAQAIGGASILYAEACAALAAAHRANRIANYQQANRNLVKLWSNIEVVIPDLSLCITAGRIAAQESLRGYDAVRLAAALRFHADILVCGDGDLLQTAQNHHLSVVDGRF